MWAAQCFQEAAGISVPGISVPGRGDISKNTQPEIPLLPSPCRPFHPYKVKLQWTIKRQVKTRTKTIPKITKRYRLVFNSLKLSLDID